MKWSLDWHTQKTVGFEKYDGKFKTKVSLANEKSKIRLFLFYFMQKNVNIFFVLFTQNAFCLCCGPCCICTMYLRLLLYSTCSVVRRHSLTLRCVVGGRQERERWATNPERLAPRWFEPAGTRVAFTCGTLFYPHTLRFPHCCVVKVDTQPFSTAKLFC